MPIKLKDVIATGLGLAGLFTYFGGTASPWVSRSLWAAALLTASIDHFRRKPEPIEALDLHGPKKEDPWGNKVDESLDSRVTPRR
jgi:hypothetical protein